MSFIKNVASSLARKTLPKVAKGIFPHESEKLADFTEKLMNAKELMHEAKQDVAESFSAFSGVGPTSRKFTQQLRSGKFGMTSDEENAYMFKKLGMDDSEESEGESNEGGMPDFGDLKLDDGDDDDNSTTGIGEGSTTNNFTTSNTRINVQGPVASGITAGEAILNERMMVNGEASNLASTNILGFLSRVANDVSNVKEVISTQATIFYDASLEHYKSQADIASKMEDLLPMMSEWYTIEKEKRDAESAKKLGLNVEDSESILDPQRAMEKLTGGIFSQLFGEMSPIASMLNNFSTDPLGALIGGALGASVGKVLESQIETIQNQFHSMEYRLQDTLEEWANRPSDPDSPLSEIQKKFAQVFKIDRREDNNVTFGSFEKEAVPFDAQTRKSIVDVIPMYLAKILKAVSGSKTHDVYDWQNGKFDTDKNINKRTKGEVTNISEGNYLGGLGFNLKSSLAEMNLSDKESAEKIRKGILDHALSRKSSSIMDLSTLDLGDEATNAKFSELLGNMSSKDRLDMMKSFRSHRFERMKALDRYETSMQSTGGEAAAILSGKDFKIKAEHGRITPTIIPPRVDGSESPGNTEDRARRDPNNPDDTITDRDRNEKNFFDKLLDISSKLQTKFTDSVTNPLKNFLGGGEEGSKDRGFLDLITSSFNRNIIFPFKKALVGEDSAKEMSLFQSISHKFDQKILTPFKKALLGKRATDEEVNENTLWSAMYKRYDESVLSPLKQRLVGKDRANDMGFFKAVYTRFDESALMPLKKILLGKDAKNDLVKQTGLFKAVQFRIDESILTPLKHALLGKEVVDRTTAAGTSLLSAIGTRIDNSILFPLKKVLFGGNETKAANKNIFQAMGERFNRSVLFPLKKVLLGGDKRSGASIYKTSLMQAMMTGYKERILQPLNAYLFGEDKRKGGFFSNLGEVVSPFFNKLLFGQDRASKAGLLDNIKEVGSKLWGNIWSGMKEKFFQPMANALKEFFGPTLKEFATTLKDEVVHFGKNILGKLGNAVGGGAADGLKSGLKGVMKTILGDETVKLLRENVVDPLKKLTETLTENASKVLKFMLRLPINFLRGVTDTMKIGRMNSGRGNFSEAEVKRLKELEATGKVFNFLDLGQKKLTETTTALANESKERTNFFTRVFGKGKDKVETPVVNTVTPKANVADTIVENTGAVKEEPKTKEQVARTKANDKLLRASAENANKQMASANKSGKITSITPIVPKETTSNSLTTVTNVSETAASSKIKEAISEGTNTTAKLAILHNNLGGITTKLSALVGRLLGNEQEEKLKTPNKVSTVASGGSGDIITAEAANRAAIKTESHLAVMMPFIIRGAEASSSMLEFAKKNLTKLDTRSENVVRLLRKAFGMNTKGILGSEKVGLFTNPISWITNKVTGFLGIGGKIIGGLATSVGKTLSAIATIPGKIAGSVASMISTMVNASAQMLSSIVKVTADAIGGVANALTGMLKGLGTALGSVVSGLAKAVGGVVEGIGNFTKQVAGPLGKAIGDVTSSLVKGLVPVIGSVAKGFSSLIEGTRVLVTDLTKAAWKITTTVGRTVGNLLGGTLNKVMGGKLTAGFTANTNIANFAELLGLAKSMPMDVIVRDGRIQTYTKKERRKPRATAFVDKVEARSLVGKSDKGLIDVKKDKKKGLLAGILGGLLGGAGGLLGGLLGGGTKTGGGLIGTIFGGVGKIFSKLGGIGTKLLGGIAKLGGTIRNATIAIWASNKLKSVGGGITDLLGKGKGKAGKVLGKIFGRGAATATAGSVASRGAASAVTTAATTGAASAAGGAAAKGIGSKVLGFLGKGAKGLGVGSAIGLGGSLLADGLFEKGSLMHGITSSGSTGAGWGATVGSIIPGVGTMVGGILGGIGGVLYEAVPRTIKWAENKFEGQIREATEYFTAIPERITAFAEELPKTIDRFASELPDKMLGWLDTLPTKIAGMFMNDTTTVDENGEVTEDKPSILGRLLGAVGSAAWSVIKAIPRIAASILEGAIKVGIATTVTAGSYIGKVIKLGVGSIGNSIGQIFDNAMIYFKRKANEWTFGAVGITEEEAKKQKEAVNKKYSDKAKQLEESLKEDTAETKENIKALTNWSVADKIPTGTPSSKTTNKATYNEAMASSGNDTTRALEVFTAKSGMEASAARKEFFAQHDQSQYMQKMNAAQNSVVTASENAQAKNESGAAVVHSNLNGVMPETYPIGADLAANDMNAMQNPTSSNKVVNLANYNDQNIQQNTGVMAGPYAATTPLMGASMLGSTAGMAGAVRNVFGNSQYMGAFQGQQQGPGAADGVYGNGGAGTTVGEMRLADGNTVPQVRGKGWPNVKDTIIASAKVFGIDPSLMAGVSAVESGFDPNIRAKGSTASGLFQFIDSTWRAMLKKYGGRFGLSPATSPLDGRANSLMGAAYIRENAQVVQSIKGSATPTDVYMAHFLGSGGVKTFLTALKNNPNASAAAVMPKAAGPNRGIFFHSNGAPRSVAQVYNLMNEKLSTRAGQFGVNLGNLGASATPQQFAQQAGATLAPKKGHDPQADAIIQASANIGKGINVTGLNGAFKSQFAHAIQEYMQRTKRKVQINSAYRSIEEQAYLYRTKPKGYAAKPGSSLHNFGFAVDINSSDANAMDSMGLLAKYGLERPLPHEKWHIQPKGITKAMAAKGVMSADAPINQTEAMNTTGENNLYNLASKDPDRLNRAIGMAGNRGGNANMSAEDVTAATSMLDSYLGGVSAINDSMSGNKPEANKASPDAALDKQLNKTVSKADTAAKDTKATATPSSPQMPPIGIIAPHLIQPTGAVASGISNAAPTGGVAAPADSSNPAAVTASDTDGYLKSMGTMFGNVNSDYAEGKGPVVTGKQKSSNAGESARRNAMTTKSVSVPTQSAEVLGSRVEKTDTPTNTVSVGTTPVEKKPVNVATTATTGSTIVPPSSVDGMSGKGSLLEAVTGQNKATIAVGKEIQANASRIAQVEATANIAKERQPDNTGLIAVAEAVKSTVTSKQPDLTVEALILEEMRKQTAHLETISKNSASLPTTQNFFEGHKKEMAGVRSFISQQTAKETITNTERAVAGQLDSFPEYMSPSAGAYKVSKGGSN